MAYGPGRPIPRRIAVAQLHRIADDYAGGYRAGVTRTDALMALAAVSTDPDLLAEAAAIHALADNWYAIEAVRLLIEGGADRDLIDHHASDATADPTAA